MPSEVAPPVDVTGRPVRLRELDLDRLLSPRTIAVIGASDTPGGASALNYRLIKGWAGSTGARVIPVNPNRDEVDGDRCYPDVGEVGEEVDVAVLLVGAAVVLDALASCIEAKVPFAVVFASGFAEAGPSGAALQAELEAMVAAADIHVLGPNTALNAFQPFRREGPGRRIALVTQSGQQGRPVYQAQDLGVSLEGWAPTGNEADLESADFIRHFADRPGVGAVACYLEGFKDGRTFVLAADHAAQRGVPIVAVKVGRSEIGRSWAQSHSGHLAGSDAVTQGVFDQYGVVRVDGLDELLDTAVLFARAAPPATDGVAVYAISGGAGAHVADLAAARGLRLPELATDTQRRLREWIPGYLRVSNPVDSGGLAAGDERGRAILSTILSDPGVGVLVVPVAGYFPGLADRLASDLVAVSETTDKPICVVWGSPTADEDAYREILLGSPLPVFRSVTNGLDAIKAYLDHHAFVARYRSPFGKPVRRPLPAAKRARSRLGDGGALSEHASKEVLRAYGIPVTRDVLCSSAAEAVRAAKAIGYPVVAKACAPGLAHKSDVGAVRVGLRSDREVRDAFAALAEVAEDVLVCEMVTGGVECILGVVADEVFGPTVMFGLGGVAVEVFGDVVFRVPPFDRAEAKRMVSSIRAFPLLRGARGTPPADLKALVEVIMKVQRLAMDLADDIRELDVNPLLARPDGAVALDALVVAS